MYKQFLKQLQWVFILMAVLVAVQLVNSLSGGAISGLGIWPRQPQGLIGIPLAPFIHHSWYHLLSNAIPLAVLLLLGLQVGKRRFWQATVGIVVLGGLGVWLFASSGVHAGASGLVFGYWGFLLAYAWFDRNLKSLLIALLVVFLYGGLVFSFVSFRPHVSWASHFFGAIAGVMMAWILSRSRR